MAGTFDVLSSRPLKAAAVQAPRRHLSFSSAGIDGTANAPSFVHFPAFLNRVLHPFRIAARWQGSFGSNMTFASEVYTLLLIRSHLCLQLPP